MHRLLKAALAGTAALAMSAAATGCGSGSTSKGASESTVRVWIMGDDGRKFSDLVADFTKSTNIKVQVDAIPWDNVNEKLTTAVASGNGPDVMQIGLSLLSSFQSAGALLDLTPHFGGHAKLKSENFVDAVSPDKLKLAQRGKGKYGYYIPQWDAPLPIQLTWQAGGDITDSSGKINLDTPEFRRAVDFYLSFYRDKLVPTASDFDQAQGFISGAAPMLISGPYLAKAVSEQAPNLAGKWAVAPLPADKAGTALFAGSNMGVWHKSANVEASMKLLDFLSDPATQLNWFKINGELPTVKSALSDPSLTSDPNVQVYAKQLQKAKLLPVLPAWDKISKELLDSLNTIALKRADPTATLAKLNQDVANLQK